MVKWGESTSQSQTRPLRALHGSVGDSAAKAPVCFSSSQGLEVLPAFQRHALPLH